MPTGSAEGPAAARSIPMPLAQQVPASMEHQALQQNCGTKIRSLALQMPGPMAGPALRDPMRRLFR